MGMGCTGRKVCTDIENEIMQDAHHNTLNHLVSMDKWVEQPLNEIRRASDGRIETWVQRQHRMYFMTWI
jgi:hypothetical protein